MQCSMFPYVYTVRTDAGKLLGEVTELHKLHVPGKPGYLASRLAEQEKVQERVFAGFTAALQFVAGVDEPFKCGC